jgi:hypothetical protein
MNDQSVKRIRARISKAARVLVDTGYGDLTTGQSGVEFVFVRDVQVFRLTDRGIVWRERFVELTLFDKVHCLTLAEMVDLAKPRGDALVTIRLDLKTNETVSIELPYPVYSVVCPLLAQLIELLKA